MAAGCIGLCKNKDSEDGWKGMRADAKGPASRGALGTKASKQLFWDDLEEGCRVYSRILL